MATQTRAVLGGYAAAGGCYREVAIDDAAHSPHLDQPDRFVAELGAHLSSA
jgi:pimeloyl-ACP methyl ester carboxylesterase